MKQSEFIKRIKLKVPNFSSLGISDTDLTDLLNEACDESNLEVKVYSGYKDFNIVANQSIYNLSTIVPTYLGTDKRGLFFKDSSDVWARVYPKTEAWISKVYPNYLNSTYAAIPTWYWINGDELGFHPGPSTSKAGGARLYHLKKANPMTSGDHYPFTGNATEITALKPLDKAIIAYVRWKLTPSYGKMTDVDLGEREFKYECKQAAKQIKRRKDLTHDSGYVIQL